MLEGGVLPVIKHIPGHGRGTVDSHFKLPVVRTPRDALEATDFEPFRALAAMPWAMTAHIVYTAVDAERPATLSPRLIEEVIRGSIGFDGVLVSDDLSMKALGGSFAERARGALAAGCNLVLHCNGDLKEMTEVAGAIGRLSPASARRVGAAEARRRAGGERFDRQAAEARFDALLAGQV
jgi:beta-N-acetylhexosaminidase